MSIETLTFREHTLELPINTGDNVLANHLVCIDFKWKYIEASNALLKIIDEILCNACDAVLETKSKICVEFEKGHISVRDFGTGIKIENDARGWTVQRCFCAEYTSSTFRQNNSIKASTNGLGAKLTNIFSKSFTVETANGGKKYKQTYRENMLYIDEPEIIEYSGASGTKITFLPDYDKLCKISKTQDSKDWIVSNFENLKGWIKNRCLQISLYSGAPVYFNKEPVSYNIKKFSEKFSTDYLNIEHMGFQISVVFTRENLFRHISILNGVCFEDVSNYVEKFISVLESQIMEIPEFTKIIKLEEGAKNMPAAYFRNLITFICVGSYPKEYFNFVGQVKSKAMINRVELSKLGSAKFPEHFISQIWKRLKSFYSEMITRKNKNTKAKPKLYEPAQNHKAEALFLVEGNSASTLIKKIIEQNPKLSYKTHGLFSTGGIPCNAVKQTQFVGEYPMQSNLLVKNDTLQSLVNVLGLVYDSKQNVKDLKYKKIIIATDQDSDGIGKITSLIICFFMIYFKNIVDQDFIYRFRTPLVRTAKGEYFSEKEYKEKDGSKADYFKGLATHEKKHIKDMAKNYESNLISLKRDEEAWKYMNILYNKATRERKLILLEGLKDIDYKDPLNVNITEHFLIESIAEQLQNIKRKITNYYDGFLPVQRKIFMASRIYLKKKMKIAAFSGLVIAHLGYHHGEASLHKATVKMAQNFAGSCNIATILAVSDGIGGQDGGRGETGQPRYIDIAYASITDLLFPPVDDALLDYEPEDGEFYEPKFYVPIIPRVLIENADNVATGWNSIFTGRDFNIICKRVLYSIKYEPKCGELFGHANIYEGMRIIVFKGQEFCLGRYHIENNKIIITQLPICKWAKQYVERWKKDAYFNIIAAVFNHSGNNIKIEIELKEGAMAIMTENWKSSEYSFMTPIEHGLKLYKILKRNLNFFNETIREFGSIDEIFKVWFEKRKEIYIKRLKREDIILRAKILKLENMIKFLIEENLTKKNKEKIYEILNEKYAKIDDKYLNSKIREANLEEKIYTKDDKKGYDYLLRIPIGRQQEEKVNKLKLELEELRKIKIKTWQETWTNEILELMKFKN